MHSPFDRAPSCEASSSLTSHRFASWSYTTTGSLLPASEHRPPAVVQRLLKFVGPLSSAPSLFWYTARLLFTPWTYCVVPTSPTGSGGRQPQLLPTVQAPAPAEQIPSKEMLVA